MKLKKPQFWDYKKPNIIAYFLWPISITLQFLNSFKKIFISKKKFKNIKTICIGNIYIGGTGKTPLVNNLAVHFKKKFNNLTKINESHVFIKNFFDVFLFCV